MEYVNCTPHAIKLNDGRVFAPSGNIPRVSCTYSDIVDDVCVPVYGDVQGLPESTDGVLYIVSAMVLAATDRDDLVAPATGHPETVRNDKGHIVSVPCFVRG